MDISTFTAHRRTLSAGTGTIAYTEFGEGPAAVFVHGIGSNGAWWRHVIEQLAGATRCVAIDLPAHGGTPARDDLSVAAMAGVVTELCDALGLGPVDLVGGDTGGAVAQVVAARRPELLRTLTLTNCDTDGNFPPPDLAPIIETARQGQLAGLVRDAAGQPGAWRATPFAGLYEHPENIPDEAWTEYLRAFGGTLDRAHNLERLLTSLDPKDLSDVQPALRALDVPTLIVWGTGDAMFGLKWAYLLRETIPGATDVLEVDGAKVFFPEERPADLVPHLREFWSR